MGGGASKPKNTAPDDGAGAPEEGAATPMKETTEKADSKTKADSQDIMLKEDAPAPPSASPAVAPPAVAPPKLKKQKSAKAKKDSKGGNDGGAEGGGSAASPEKAAPKVAKSESQRSFEEAKEARRIMLEERMAHRNLRLAEQVSA